MSLPPPSLMLVHGPRRWLLGTRALSIGRLPESDVTLPGEQVSRTHAYIVPTPEGPLLVDGSRLGTSVNGERMKAPWILADGDEIQVGTSVLRVRPSDLPAGRRSDGVAIPGWGSRLRHWVRRYGPSEVMGTIVAVGAAGATYQLTESTAASAYAGSLAETVTFYGIMFLRDTMREAHQAGRVGRPYTEADLLRVMRNLLLEFGVAEAIDTLLFRPLLMGLGIRWIGVHLGALAGKLAADVLFYGPVLAIYEWRLARRRSVGTDRRRRTTAVGLPRPE